MEEVKDIVKSVVADLTRKHRREDLDRAQKAWKRCVGPAAFVHSRIVHLTKERIRVNVDSSAWLYDLNLRKGRIVRELARSLNIKEVSLRLGEVRERGEEKHGKG